MKKIKWFINDHAGPLFLSLMLFLLCFCLYGITVGASERARLWEQFKIDNDCVKVGHIEGSVDVGMGLTASGTMGMITTVQSDRVQWKCSDGVTYTKEA